MPSAPVRTRAYESSSVSPDAQGKTSRDRRQQEDPFQATSRGHTFANRCCKLMRNSYQWIGLEKLMRKNQVSARYLNSQIRLYKTTFQNPHYPPCNRHRGLRARPGGRTAGPGRADSRKVEACWFLQLHTPKIRGD